MFNLTVPEMSCVCDALKSKFTGYPSPLEFCDAFDSAVKNEKLDVKWGVSRDALVSRLSSLDSASIRLLSDRVSGYWEVSDAGVCESLSAGIALQSDYQSDEDRRSAEILRQSRAVTFSDAHIEYIESEACEEGANASSEFPENGWDVGYSDYQKGYPIVRSEILRVEATSRFYSQLGISDNPLGHKAFESGWVGAWISDWYTGWDAAQEDFPEDEEIQALHGKCEADALQFLVKYLATGGTYEKLLAIAEKNEWSQPHHWRVWNIVLEREHGTDDESENYK